MIDEGEDLLPDRSFGGAMFPIKVDRGDLGNREKNFSRKVFFRFLKKLSPFAKNFIDFSVSDVLQKIIS